MRGLNEPIYFKSGPRPFIINCAIFTQSILYCNMKERHPSIQTSTTSHHSRQTNEDL